MKKMKLSEICGFQLHPIRQQMVMLPSLSIVDNLEDLDGTETSVSQSLQSSIADNGILSPIIICGNFIVDGLRRVDVAKTLYSEETEIPVLEVSENDVLANIIAAITTSRTLTIQQRVFNIYQFVRTDHLKCIAYGEALQKSKLLGQNYNIAVPSIPVNYSVFNGANQTNYFSKYLIERENNPEIKSPCVWLAERLGCNIRYLSALDKIWDYLESLDEEHRIAKFNAAIELVNISGNSLNTILPALNGMDSERDDLDEANSDRNMEKWFMKCKSSFAGLAGKVNQEYLSKAPDAKKRLFEYVQNAGFKRESASMLRDIFADLVKQIDKQNS